MGKSCLAKGVKVEWLFQVYVLPKFTIPDDKLLMVELYEKNGGRHQSIRVENADIVNAKEIDELKMK